MHDSSGWRKGAFAAQQHEETGKYINLGPCPGFSSTTIATRLDRNGAAHEPLSTHRKLSELRVRASGPCLFRQGAVQIDFRT